jgi:hypothetical protein
LTKRERINSGPDEVRKFGILFAGISCAVAALLSWTPWGLGWFALVLAALLFVIAGTWQGLFRPAFTLALAWGALGFYLQLDHTTAILWPSLAASFFLLTGFFATPVLRPVYIGWMKFAFALAWVNTRIILGVSYYVVLTPIGLVMRLFGKDFLSERIDRSASTYWIKRAPQEFDPRRYEKLF